MGLVFICNPVPLRSRLWQVDRGLQVRTNPIQVIVDSRSQSEGDGEGEDQVFGKEWLQGILGFVFWARLTKMTGPNTPLLRGLIPGGPPWESQMCQVDPPAPGRA